MTAEIKHGKEKGRHAQNALSDAFVRSAKGPEFYADGNGLYLKVDASGARRSGWRNGQRGSSSGSLAHC